LTIEVVKAAHEAAREAAHEAVPNGPLVKLSVGPNDPFLIHHTATTASLGYI
jgi:hypothetical protein